jgi:hypothetical protein
MGFWTKVRYTRFDVLMIIIIAAILETVAESLF